MAIGRQRRRRRRGRGRGSWVLRCVGALEGFNFVRDYYFGFNSSFYGSLGIIMSMGVVGTPLAGCAQWGKRLKFVTKWGNMYRRV